MPNARFLTPLRGLSTLRRVELVVIPAVPILEVGMDYPLASGPHTFTESDLKAAAEAFATDPAVKAPRVKIDSLAKAWNLDEDSHGGEPAFGWADNLRVSDDGQTLLADMHVPDWLASAMEWAFPSRSIEAPPRGWQSPTGRTHDLVITAVALLGTDWPGCTTLEDFRDVLAKGPDLMPSPEGEPIIARMPTQVRASIDTELVARRFIDAVDNGDVTVPDGVNRYDVWIRSVKLDDSGRPYLKVVDESSGDLYRVDVTVTGNDVSFGALVPIVEQDVALAANTPRPPAPLRAWANMAESRPPQSQEDGPMAGLDLAALRTRLGLPEDADEAAINQALAESQPEPTPEPESALEPEREPTPEPTPEAQVPEGFTLIDTATLETLRVGAENGTAIAARFAKQERDETIVAAVRRGRIAVAARSDFEKRWDRDPEGTRKLLTAKIEDGGLPDNIIPTAMREIGTALDADADDGMQGTGLFTFDEER